MKLEVKILSRITLELHKMHLKVGFLGAARGQFTIVLNSNVNSSIAAVKCVHWWPDEGT